MEKMLERNYTKRIGLQSVKAHKWLSKDILYSKDETRSAIYDLQSVISKKAHFKNFMIISLRICIIYTLDAGFLKTKIKVHVNEL